MPPQRFHGLRRLAAVALAFGLLAVVPGQPWAQTQRPKLSPKAMWIGYFIIFNEWREDDFRDLDSAFVLGILGDDPSITKADLEVLKSSPITAGNRKRKLDVRPFTNVDEVKDGDCQVLFICSSAGRRLPSTLRIFKGRRILTISDVADVNEFFQEGGIASVAAKKTGITVSTTDQYTVEPKLNPKAISPHGEWRFKKDLFDLMREPTKN